MQICNFVLIDGAGGDLGDLYYIVVLYCIVLCHVMSWKWKWNCNISWAGLGWVGMRKGGVGFVWRDGKLEMFICA